MNPGSESGNGGHSSLFARVAGVTVGVVAIVALAAWALDVAALNSMFPGLATMKPNTALGLLLCSAALLVLLSGDKVTKSVRSLAAVSALIVIALGALSLSEYLFGWDSGIAQWWLRAPPRAAGSSHPGQMLVAAAFCFVVLGTALLVAFLPISSRLQLPIFAALGATVTVIAVLALVGYILEVGLGYRWWNYIGPAVHSPVRFTLLGCGLFVLLGCGLLAVSRSQSGLTWALDTSTTVVFLAAIALMVTAAGISYNSTDQLHRTATWVGDTQEVLKEIQELETNFVDLESNQRLYIITGDDRLLERYTRAKTEAPGNLVDVRRLTTDSPHQQDRIDRLESLIHQRVAWADQTIAARRQQGLPSAQQMIATGTGVTLSDSIRRLLKEMQDEEYVLLGARQQQLHVTSRTTFLLLPLELFLGLTMVSLGVFFLNAGVSEQVHAKHTLQDNQARLAGIVDSAMDTIISVDTEQRIVLFNGAAERMFRCPAAQAIGQPIDMFIPPRFREQHRQHIREFGTTGVTARSMGARGVLSGLRADGEEFPIEASISQLTVAGQKLHTVILRDITERQRAVAATELFAAIVESSDDAIIGKDLKSIVTSWNAGAERIFGYAARAMVGCPITRLIPPERQHEEELILDRIKRGERVRHFETVRLKNDGARIDVSVTVSPIKDATGKVVGASKVVRDITERKQAEEALRQSEAFNTDVLNSLTAHVAVLDAEGRVITVNQAWKRFAMENNAADSAYYLGTSYFAVCENAIRQNNDGHAAAALQGIRSVVDGSQEYYGLEYPCHSDSDERWFHMHVSRLTGGSRVVVTAHENITRRKRAETEVRELNADLEQRVIKRTAELEAANRELEAFSYSVSHDLRAPLRSVDGFSQAVLEDYAPQLPEEGRRYLQTIRAGAQRMGQLIDDLLMFSRLSRQPLNKRTVDTGKLVRETLEELSFQRQGRQVDVRVGDLPACQGDPALLKQVWVNLLSNALKYTRRRTSAVIEVGCLLENAVPVYFVRDNGTGFDMQYANKLFGVFQRLHRAEDFEGTGVGLAIVQRVVHRHGGRVWAKAAVDRGATFFFTLDGGTNI